MTATIDLAHIKTLRWSSSISYTVRDIIAYNVALGSSGTDLSRCFEGHPSFHALPTFASLPVIDIMGKVSLAMPELIPGFQPHNHVHGEHYLELKRPFPRRTAVAPTQLQTTARIVDVVRRRTGVTVRVGITTIDAETGLEVCYNEWTSFIMKVPGAGASTEDGASSQAAAISRDPPNRAPDAVVAEKTSAEQGALYRAASGDLNPLHIDPAVARAGGFAGPILTGTCTMGLGVKHIIDTFAAGDASRFKSVKLRLSRPVFPGEVVRTEMWRSSPAGSGDTTKIIYRQVAGGEDRVVISQAVVDLHKEPSSKL
ncbi:HotDog domain-containing protein [Xylariales sp. PMI_506]|nr:HotDog domain-containing protein [Xylariales sp. PMI_506]